MDNIIKTLVFNKYELIFNVLIGKLHRELDIMAWDYMNFELGMLF